MAQGMYMIDPRGVRDISGEVLDEQGRLRILPAAYWAGTTAPERMLFGVKHAFYSFPTVELVDWLRTFIGDRSAIEVGAGSGVLAEALGIPGTDSFQQDEPRYRATYEATKQPTVRYGPDVVQVDANAAVRRFRPDVVIGCWVTHRYDPGRHTAGGNEAGIDEEDVLEHCSAYVVVGNQRVHEGKKIWKRKHTIEYPEWVYSRAMNGSPDFVAVWRGKGAQRAKGARKPWRANRGRR